MDRKILKGISPPIASASANFSSCCRLERIIEGNKRWKITVFLGQECALQSTSQCAAHLCPSCHKQHCFSQGTLFHCGKINSFFFFSRLFSVPPPSLGLSPTSHTEVLCLEFRACLKFLPHQELLQEQLFQPKHQDCCPCQPALKQLLEGKGLVLLSFKHMQIRSSCIRISL